MNPWPPTPAADQFYQSWLESDGLAGLGHRPPLQAHTRCYHCSPARLTLRLQLTGMEGQKAKSSQPLQMAVLPRSQRSRQMSNHLANAPYTGALEPGYGVTLL